MKENYYFNAQITILNPLLTDPEEIILFPLMSATRHFLNFTRG